MSEKKNRLRVKARAVPNAFEWGVADTGTEQVGVLVQILDGELQDQQLTWYGYFTDNTEDRTIESLRTAGWDGSDILNLPGLGSTEFQLTLEEEETERGEPYWKPAFINRIGVAMKNIMGPQEKAAFAARMRAKLGSAGAGPATRAAPSSGSARQQQSRPAPRRAAGGGGPDMSAPPPGDDDIPF